MTIGGQIIDAEPVDAVPITELESRPLEIGAGCEDRHGDRMLNLRQIARKKKCTKAISMRKMRMKMRDRERDDVGTINNSAPSRKKKKKKKKKKKGRTREKERNIGQRVLLLSWAPSNVLSSVSVGYRANSRDTAVTFRNSVTRSCTYPKGTKSSSTP